MKAFLSPKAQIRFIINSFVNNQEKAFCSQNDDRSARLYSPTTNKLSLRSSPNLIWAPPTDRFCKLNFDGSKLANGQASYGFVIKNNLGDVLIAFAKALGDCHSILMAQAMGMYEGIK